jgi:uncharacterized protein YeaO (DUF488 family)
MNVSLKRIYEKPAGEDGERVLVDRLWPRGLSKQAAAIDLWLRDLAPSDQLRKWYHERPGSWPAFRKRYLQELSEEKASAALEQLYRLTRSGKVTLLFASTNEYHNNAVVLKELLDGARKPPTGTGPAAAARARKSAQARRR